MLAFLTTTVTFELVDGLLNARLGLEKNFGLADRQFFLTGSLVHRFTPRSGIYLKYYGIYRNNRTPATEKDFIFLDDTIPAGSSVELFFNTQVVSLGYLYALADTPTALFAGYLNVYLMDVSTGLKAEGLKYEENFGLLAPIPELGVIGVFKINSWLQIDSAIGFFALNTGNFDGRLNSLLFQLNFKPKKWFGITLGYEQFIVRVSFPEEAINTAIDYDFKGPSLGVNFLF